MTSMNLHGRSLLKEADFTKEEFLSIVDLAGAAPRGEAVGHRAPALAGRNIALIFEKPSTRTRSAFEVGAHDQGAHVTYLGPGESHLGDKESVKDTARVLGRMFDGIEYRGFAQETVEILGQYAGVPVWNGLTDQWHPTQMLADVLTMRDHSTKPLEEIPSATAATPKQHGELAAGDRGAAGRSTSASPRPRLAAPAAEVRAIADDWPAVRGPASAQRRPHEPRSRGPTSSTPTSGCRWASPTQSGASGSSCCCPTRSTPSS